MRRGREVKSQGFTLVELMIVIAIIAILASIAIPQYLKYQRKAKVSSYALPAVRACAMDMVAFCVENPGNNSVQPSPTTTPNCNDTSNVTISTAGGEVTLDPVDNFACDNEGKISTTGSLVKGTITNVEDYQATCEFVDASLKCTVTGK